MLSNLIGGRLSLNNSPIPSGDISSSLLKYVPYKSNKWVTAGVEKTFNSPVLDISALNGLYDIFGAGTEDLFAIPVSFTSSYQKLSGSIITTGTGANSWVRTSAAFDDSTAQVVSIAARNVPGNSGMNNFIGLDLGSTEVISKVEIWASDEDYLRGDGASSLPITVDGWDGSSWVQLHSSNLNCSVANGENAKYTITALSTTPVSKVRFGITGNGVSAINVAELAFYKTVSASPRFNVVDGIRVNTSQIGSYNAGEATYLGTIEVVSGISSITLNPGQNRKCQLWNAYNRVPLKFQCAKLETSWHYGPTSGWRKFGNYDVHLTLISGAPEDNTEVHYSQNVFCNAYTGGAQACYMNGVGWNSTSTLSGKYGAINLENGGTSMALGSNCQAFYMAQPFEGKVIVYALEGGSISGGETRAFTGVDDMLFLVEFSA